MVGPEGGGAQSWFQDLSSGTMAGAHSCPCHWTPSFPCCFVPTRHGGLGGGVFAYRKKKKLINENLWHFRNVAGGLEPCSIEGIVVVSEKRTSAKKFLTLTRPEDQRTSQTIHLRFSAFAATQIFFLFFFSLFSFSPIKYLMRSDSRLADLVQRGGGAELVLSLRVCVTQTFGTPELFMLNT